MDDHAEKWANCWVSGSLYYKEQLNWYQGNDMKKPSLHCAKRPTHELRNLEHFRSECKESRARCLENRHKELHFICGSREAMEKHSMETGDSLRLCELSPWLDAMFGRRWKRKSVFKKKSKPYFTLQMRLLTIPEALLAVIGKPVTISTIIGEKNSKKCLYLL